MQSVGPVTPEPTPNPEPGPGPKPWPTPYQLSRSNNIFYPSLRGFVIVAKAGYKTSPDLFSIGKDSYNRNESLINSGDYTISYIKDIINNWYKSNIIDKGFSSFIADSGFCNDLTKVDDNTFGAKYRIFDNKNPTLKCPNKNNFLTKTNGKLEYPVGLITMDEASFAGGHMTETSSYYLATKQTSFYWTMSPAYQSDGKTEMNTIYSKGDLSWHYVYQYNYIRPVLSVKPDINILKGDGSFNNPYMMSEESVSPSPEPVPDPNPEPNPGPGY